MLDEYIEEYGLEDQDGRNGYWDEEVAGAYSALLSALCHTTSC